MKSVVRFLAKPLIAVPVCVLLIVVAFVLLVSAGRTLDVRGLALFFLGLLYALWAYANRSSADTIFTHDSIQVMRKMDTQSMDGVHQEDYEGHNLK